jgi:hypothetical protein
MKRGLLFTLETAFWQARGLVNRPICKLFGHRIAAEIVDDDGRPEVYICGGCGAWLDAEGY